MTTIGEEIPHFELETIHHQVARYDDLWQRRFLVLVAVRDATAPDARAYSRGLETAPDLTLHDTSLIVYEPDRQPASRRPTGPVAAGLAPAPSVMLVDRWGTVQHIATAATESGLPAPQAVLEWLRYLQMQCPECEGEAR